MWTVPAKPGAYVQEGHTHVSTFSLSDYSVLFFKKYRFVIPDNLSLNEQVDSLLLLWKFQTCTSCFVNARWLCIAWLSRRPSTCKTISYSVL